MQKKQEVYSIAAMLYSPQFKDSLNDLPITSGIAKILATQEDNLVFCDPHDYHFTISYLEVRQEDWNENILHKIYEIISSMLNEHEIILPFMRLAVLYKYFFAEYDMNILIAFKQQLLEMMQQEVPQGIFGFETEYFPHITLARFNPKDSLKIIKKELISTSLRGIELKQPKSISPLILDSNCIIKVNARLQESNFL